MSGRLVHDGLQLSEWSDLGARALLTGAPGLIIPTLS